MKAVVYKNYGSPDVLSLEEIEMPTPNENEVLIRVYAATANRTDCANLTGRPFIMRLMLGMSKPRKQILGTDFAGVIEAVGSKVSKFKVGDRIFGFNDNILSSFAKYMVLSEDEAIAKIPDNTDFEAAAASLEGAHYAYNFINKVNVEGKTVLVHGATGAIGSACVQLCRYFGATVTATCGTGHEEQVKDLGAVRTINWQKTDFTKDREQFDFVFDTVGKSRYRLCKRLLKPNGVYISSELGPNLENIPLSIFNKHVKFPLPLDRPRSVNLMAELLQKGEFKPLIDRTYPLEEIADAFRYVLSGKKIGNVTIVFNR
ncbi:MAG: zinc-binding dehydrogenase [Flavobacteriales bacterium]|nr:zinc-binding dehydrogenase [Flavobacteriales bacterium]